LGVVAPKTNKQICHLNIKLKLKLPVDNVSFFIAIHKCFHICRFIQLYLGKLSELDTCSY